MFRHAEGHIAASPQRHPDVIPEYPQLPITVSVSQGTRSDVPMQLDVITGDLYDPLPVGLFLLRWPPSSGDFIGLAN